MDILGEDDLRSNAPEICELLKVDNGKAIGNVDVKDPSIIGERVMDRLALVLGESKDGGRNRLRADPVRPWCVP